MSNGVSIIIPHYKTKDLAQLCLRSIKYYTNHSIEVIVIDNGSQGDPSLEYLRKVEWIKLLERDSKNDDNPAMSHKIAMDLGISEARYPYILSIHTDTIPVHPKWLEWLLKQINSDEKIAAVGNYKLEIKSFLQLFFKRLEYFLGFNSKADAGTSENPVYIRSHCALYRTKLLEDLGLKFVSPNSAGRDIHFGLIEAGYKTKLLPACEMLKYVVHLNHGTMVFHPELGARTKTIRKGIARIESFFQKPLVRKIYEDESLDYGTIG